MLCFRIFVLVWVTLLPLGPLNACLRARKRVPQDLFAAQEKLRGAFRVEQLQQLSLVVGNDVLRLDQLVKLAIRVQLGHDGAQPVTALHLTLAGQRDRVAEVAKAFLHGGVIGGNSQGRSTAFHEQLLDELLLALARTQAGFRDVVEVGVGGSMGRRSIWLVVIVVFGGGTAATIPP